MADPDSDPGLNSAAERPKHSHFEQDAALLDLAFDAIFTRGFRDRLIRFWNRGAAELYGWSAAEARGTEPEALLGSRYPIPLEEIEWHLLSSGRWEGEIIHRTRDGREITVSGRWALRRDADGEPLEILEINSDISARKVAEEQLRRSEERFRLLISNITDYAIFQLDAQGYVTTWNEGAERTQGYRYAEIVGKHLALLYPSADVIAGRPTRELQIAKSEGRFSGEGWRLRKDGTELWATFTISALRDTSGFLHGFAVLMRDMTDQRRQQERALEVERHETELAREHAARLARLEEAKSQFLNLASHELRGPLAVIGGYLSLIEEGALGSLNDLGQQVLPVLVGKVAEMNRLVEQMIDLARLDEGRVQLAEESFDLRDLVAEMAQRARSLMDERHLVEAEMSPKAVPIRADRERVATIVANLLDNAIKYSPDGGTVRCTLSTNGLRAMLQVADEGVGIAPADMDKLFTRFGRIVTADNSHVPGTGLGLYLCRELARMHGGDITAESTAGQGSVFTLTLPLH